MRRFQYFVLPAFGIQLCVLMRSSSQAILERLQGSPVTLPCPEIRSDQDVIWYKVEPNLSSVRILLRIGVTIVVPTDVPDVWKNNQISIVNDADLLIHSPRAERDSGQFVCVDVSNNKNVSVRVVVLALTDVSAHVTGVTIGGFQGDTVTLAAGESITLSCDVFGDPNPPPTYTWGIVDTVLVSGASDGVYRLTGDATMNEKTLRCTATNSYNNSTILSSHDGTAILDITYLLGVSIQQSPISVVENDTVTLVCSVTANPPSGFEWRRAGTLLVRSSEYKITRVNRTEAGNYTCHAFNVVRNITAYSSLIIQYPPDVSVTYNSTTGALVCIARGVPDSYTFSPWEQRLAGQLIRKLPDPIIEYVSQTLEPVSRLTYQDTGNYICTVTNGIGKKQTGQTMVIPEDSAVFAYAIESFISLSTRDPKGIPISFYSNPQYSTVEWTKDSTNETLVSHIEVPGPVTLFVYNKTSRFAGFTSILTLEDVSAADEGNYTIRVHNVVYGVARTAKFVIFVNITDMPANQLSDEHEDSNTYEDDLSSGSIVGPVVGALAGVLVLVVVITSVFVWRGRRKHTGSKSGGAADNKKPDCFRDPRWREPGAEIAENDLYESVGLSASSIQKVSPPRQAKPNVQHAKKDLPRPPPPTGKHDEHELTMVGNTLYESGGDPPTSQSRDEKRAKRNKTPKKGSQMTYPCELYGGQEPGSQSNNVNEEMPPVYAQVDLSKKKGGPKVNEDVTLNYTQVEFPKQKKKKKKVIHRSEPTTNYADINFNSGDPEIGED